MSWFQTFLGGSQVLSGIFGVGAAREEAELAIKASELEQMALRHRADMARLQGQDIIAQADEDVFRRQQQVSQMMGSQKVSLAAQGIVVEGEIGQALAKEEKQILREDSAAIKNNAWREAFGLEISARDFENKAAYSAIEARGKSTQLIQAGYAVLAEGSLKGAETIMKGYTPGRKKSFKVDTSKAKVSRSTRTDYGSIA